MAGCQGLVEDFLEEEKARLSTEEEWSKRKELDGRYEVGRILDVNFKESGRREFLIRWKGHGAVDDTWQPEGNLYCVEMIRKFLEKHEEVTEVEEKTLRVAPKRVDRLALSYSPRYIVSDFCMVTDSIQYQGPNKEEEQALSETGYQDQGGIQENISRHGLNIYLLRLCLNTKQEKNLLG